MSTYAEQSTWQQLRQLFPASHRMPDDFLPQEEWFDWQGHRVHLDCYRNPQAPAKVILLHGVGTNGRQMQMVLGWYLAQQGFETIAIDMPTYGMTQVNPSKTVVYQDWIQLGSDYIDAELQKDPRPVFLYGLSAGGMATYDVAATNGQVKGIIGMTFLDHSQPHVRRATTRDAFVNHVGRPLMPLLIKLGLGKLKMKMSQASKMHLLCNSREAMEVFKTDRTSANNSATFTFLNSYMSHTTVVPPEQFDVCPVLLTQPDDDAWTPLELSQPFLKRIQKVPVKTVLLPQGGHYPMEASALQALHQHSLAFIRQCLQSEPQAPKPPKH